MNDATQVVVAIVVSAISGLVSAVIGIISMRPKTQADVEVARSGDARGWVDTFRQDAKEARERAEAAEAKADDAEEKADECKRRCDRCEQMVADAVAHIVRCHEAIMLGTRMIPELPPTLRDYLPPEGRLSG